eukprot:2550180-Alexandrium_andersonii.AAC.1
MASGLRAGPRWPDIESLVAGQISRRPCRKAARAYRWAAMSLQEMPMRHGHPFRHSILPAHRCELPRRKLHCQGSDASERSEPARARQQ